MAKTNKHNMDSDPTAIFRTTYCLYMNDIQDIDYPSKSDWRKSFCKCLIVWSEKKDSLEIEQFCEEHKIPRQTLYDWRTKHPEIRNAIDMAKINLASHRRVQSMQKRLDGDRAYKNLHKYDPEWDEINKYWAALAKDQKESLTKENLKEVLNDFNLNLEDKKSE